MPARAKDGTRLAVLVQMAIPACQAAQHQCPRMGPGRPPEFADWMMVVLILVAILMRRKSKSAQYRFLLEHRGMLLPLLKYKRFPSRSTYFDRYKRLHRLLQVAVKIQGRQAINSGLTDGTTVAVDKSLFAARGVPWRQRDKKAGRKPSGVDPQAGWGYSEHHDWVYGYGLETVVAVTKNSVVFPLIASVETANVNERRSVLEKIPQLPSQTRNVVADCGYDSNTVGERIEYDDRGCRTRRRFICPLQCRSRGGKVGRYPHRGQRGLSLERRRQRLAFYETPQGRRLYRRRQMIEPFHDWFKERFELMHQVWHWGLDNNRTQMLAAMFAYQLLVRYNHSCGKKNGQIQWILDCL
jgi:hypothetical protein